MKCKNARVYDLVKYLLKNSLDDIKLTNLTTIQKINELIEGINKILDDENTNAEIQEMINKTVIKIKNCLPELEQIDNNLENLISNL